MPGGVQGQRGVRFVRPFEGGVPGDLEATRLMLRHLLRVAHGRRFLTTPRLAIAVPSQITDVQQRALAVAAAGAGARKLTLVPTPLAAALGAGLPVDEPPAVMIVDLGAVITDIAVISMGTLVTARTVRVGGESLDQAIVSYVRRNRSALVSIEHAATAKSRMGADGQWGYGRPPLMLTGRDPDNGLPRPVMLAPADIAAAISGPMESVIRAIRETLAGCPPEIVRDLTTNGITLTGSGARLSGLTTLLWTRTGLPARVADAPSEATVLGAARQLERARPAGHRWLSRRDRRHGFLTAPRYL